MSNTGQPNDELTRYITGEIYAGIPDHQIITTLMQQGWAQSDAESAVYTVRNQLEAASASQQQQSVNYQQAYYPQPDYNRETKARRDAGLRKIGIGALLFFGGIIVTAITYSAAVGRGGGTYVVATGAIVGGLINMIIGLTMLR